MKVDVRYFAAAREAAGCESERFDLEGGATVARLRDEVAKRHAGVARLARTLRYAVDERFAGDDEPLRDGALVAVIPPVSGG